MSEKASNFQIFFRAYHCNNTKHEGLRIPVGTENINTYFQGICLPGYFAVETSNFAVATLQM